MDGTALQRCFLMDGPAPCRNGPVRVATLFTMDGTPLKRLLDYGQGHISTLFSMDGSAPKHSLLWAGPHRARTKTFITMGGSAAGPHYYGRARTRTAPGPQRALITMGGPAPGHSLLWAGPQRARIPMGGPATPFGPYKVISKRCEEDGLLHNAKLLSSIFTNQITLYLSPAPKRCKCSDDARHLPQTRYACNLDGAHFQFPCAWRACPHMLKANPGLEPLILWHGHLPRVWRAKWYPFFLTQMPCIRVPSLYIYMIHMLIMEVQNPTIHGSFPTPWAPLTRIGPTMAVPQLFCCFFRGLTCLTCLLVDLSVSILRHLWLKGNICSTAITQWKSNAQHECDWCIWFRAYIVIYYEFAFYWSRCSCSLRSDISFKT